MQSCRHGLKLPGGLLCAASRGACSGTLRKYCVHCGAQIIPPKPAKPVSTKGLQGRKRVKVRGQACPHSRDPRRHSVCLAPARCSAQYAVANAASIRVHSGNNAAARHYDHSAVRSCWCWMVARVGEVVRTLPCEGAGACGPPARFAEAAGHPGRRQQD